MSVGRNLVKSSIYQVFSCNQPISAKLQDIAIDGYFSQESRNQSDVKICRSLRIILQNRNNGQLVIIFDSLKQMRPQLPYVQRPNKGITSTHLSPKRHLDVSCLNEESLNRICFVKNLLPSAKCCNQSRIVFRNIQPIQVPSLLASAVSTPTKFAKSQLKLPNKNAKWRINEIIQPKTVIERIKVEREKRQSITNQNFFYKSDLENSRSKWLSHRISTSALSKIAATPQIIKLDSAKSSKTTQLRHKSIQTEHNNEHILPMRSSYKLPQRRTGFLMDKTERRFFAPQHGFNRYQAIELRSFYGSVMKLSKGEKGLFRQALQSVLSFSNIIVRDNIIEECIQNFQGGSEPSEERFICMLEVIEKRLKKEAVTDYFGIILDDTEGFQGQKFYTALRKATTVRASPAIAEKVVKVIQSQHAFVKKEFINSDNVKRLLNEDEQFFGAILDVIRSLGF